ncbi:MAG: GNAT family N-acetyltransferase [Myxococcota bacterium]
MEATPVALRRARKADSFAAFAVRRKAILNLSSSELSRAEADAWATGVSLGRLAQSIADHEVWVATIGPRIAGWVRFRGNRIRGLYVEPSAAGAGIGSLLLDRAEGLIAQAGYPEILLEANWTAVPFYEYRGYRRAGETRPNEPVLLRKDPVEAPEDPL